MGGEADCSAAVITAIHWPCVMLKDVHEERAQSIVLQAILYQQSQT